MDTIISFKVEKESFLKRRCGSGQTVNTHYFAGKLGTQFTQGDSTGQGRKSSPSKY